MSWLTKCCVAIMFLVCSTSKLTAQDITGAWSGYFITDKAMAGYSDTFRFGIRIEKNKRGKFTATTLSHQGVFYAEASARVSFNNEDHTYNIDEKRLIRASPESNIASPCLMFCTLSYSKTEIGEELTGNFRSHSTGKSRMDCGGGSIYLRKLESD